MASTAEKGGRLLALCLVTFFFIQVFFSANKLREEKTSVSATKQYEEKRDMPSISVCFKYKKADYRGDELVKSVEATINNTRQVKLTY